jgi:predicted phage terminase large subunit-like protein
MSSQGWKLSSPPPNLDVVRLEWARRRLDRFAPHVDDHVQPARHHRLLIDQLHEVYAGRLKRLMVFWPPGHAKSTYASHYGPSYFVGKYPRKSIIHCSHTLELAERFGRKIRNTLMLPEVEELFGRTVANDNRAAGRWETTKGGEYYAAGVGGSITGRRADLGLIDDPVKSRKEADSPTYRESTWQWYLQDFRTRLKPGAAIVIIQTRWHEDDLSGRILPKDYDYRSGWVTARDGERWFVLNFPAICEREDDGTGRKIGDALWPDWYTLAMLEQERVTQGSRGFDALYQQRPRPGEGGIFKEAWCKSNRWGEWPVDANVIVHSWDTAQKENELLNDPSALTVWGRGRNLPGYYLREAYAEHLDYPTLKRKVINFAERDRPSAILIEDKSSGTSLIQDLRAETSLPVIPIEPEGDKIFRANEVSAMAEAGLVRLPLKAPWLIDFEGEFFGFPLSTFKDQVDSVTQFLRWVRNSSGAIQSAGAGMHRVFAAQAEEGQSSRGYGSVGRGGGDTTGFN